MDASTKPAPKLLSQLRPDAYRPGASEFELVNYLTQQLPATEVVGARWFSYNDATGCWEDGTKDDYRHIALACISGQQRRIRLAHSILDHYEDTARRKLNFCGAFKADGLAAVLINTLNKVLRVSADKIEVLEHDRAFRFTRSLEVDYVPGAINELLMQQLPLTLPDALDRDLFQMLNGNIFIPDARYEVFGVIYGEAGSGKDTIMAPIVALFGPPERGLITTFSINQISDASSYVLPMLQFAAVNVCTELNSREVEDSSIFKMLVSGQPISTRMIYDKPINMSTACKQLFLTNNMPNFRFGTAAEGRRLRALYTTYKPEKVDVMVKERLKACHPGTLNWMIEGLQRLLRMGPQPMPLGGERSQEVHTRFSASNDPIKDFVTNYCVMEKANTVSNADMLKAVAAYGEDNNLHSNFVRGFLQKMLNRFPNLQTRRLGSDGERIRILTGIKLNMEGIKLAADGPAVFTV
jgi:putative DNA primase/helicase